MKRCTMHGSYIYEAGPNGKKCKCEEEEKYEEEEEEVDKYEFFDDPCSPVDTIGGI